MAESSSPFICTPTFIFMRQRGHGLCKDLTLRVQTIGCAVWFLQAPTSQNQKLGRKIKKAPRVNVLELFFLVIRILSADSNSHPLFSGSLWASQNSHLSSPSRG